MAENKIIKRICELNAISQNALLTHTFTMNDETWQKFDKEVVKHLYELGENIWKEAQKELLEELREYFQTDCSLSPIVLDYWIEEKLKKLSSN